MTDTRTRCDGCGQVADTEYGEPWSYWMQLPVQSASAVLMGILKPIPCPVCGGSRHTLNPDANPVQEAEQAVIVAATDLVTWAKEGNVDTRESIIMAGGALRRLRAAVAALDAVQRAVWR